MNTTALAPVAAAIALIALSGNAQAREEVKISKTVNAADVDVNTAAGASKLYSRLEKAARAVCSDNLVGLDSASASCTEDALGDAIRSVNRPQLTMVYLRSHSIQTAAAHGITIPTLLASK